MTYDITTKTAPAMPKLGKGLDFVKLVLSQISPDMREPIAPTLFDAAAAHISATEFLYPDQSWKELCQSCTLSLMASALRNIMSLIYYDDIPCCILKMSAVFYVSF